MGADGKERLQSRPLPLEIEVSRVSEAARDAVESVGGSVDTLYLNKLGYRAYLKPHKFAPALGPSWMQVRHFREKYDDPAVTKPGERLGGAHPSSLY